MKSKTSSQLITAFTEVNQSMQLEKDKKEYAEFEEVLKTRARKVKKDTEEEQTFNQAIQLAEKFKSMDDHKISLEAFVDKHKTNLKTGLTRAEGERRLLADGPNKLSEKAGVHWSLKLLSELTSPFALLLWAGAILCFVAYAIGNDPSNLYLGIVICVIVVGTGLLTFYQTMKS